MKPKKCTLKSSPKRFSLAVKVKEETAYDKDFFKWTKVQADLLKRGSFEDLDIKNLREEIKALGRNDKRSLRSYTVVLLMHLLKQTYHLEGQGNSNSWQSSILNAIREIKFLIEDSPSLRNELIKIFPEAYENARQDASIETRQEINKFPKECPWKINEILPFISIKKERKSS